MKTVTLEFKDIDYKYLKEDADKHGVDIEEEIKRKIYSQYTDDEVMDEIDSLLDFALLSFDNLSMEELEERADLLTSSIETYLCDGQRRLEEEEDED